MLGSVNNLGAIPCASELLIKLFGRLGVLILILNYFLIEL
jgi:hypothetical protein